MLILIAHGSRDPDWRLSLEELRTSVDTGCPSEKVRLAFMQFAGPELREVVQEGLSQGVQHFRLLPLFMSSAGHVEKDIKPMVAELEGVFPQATLELLTPIGENPLFQGLVQAIVNNTPETGES